MSARKELLSYGVAYIYPISPIHFESPMNMRYYVNARTALSSGA